jgi:hypothetical protein
MICAIREEDLSENTVPGINLLARCERFKTTGPISTLT